MTADSDFVIVANRLPVDAVAGTDGEWVFQPSPGGLVTALRPVMADRGGVWVGWSGNAGTAPAPFHADGMRLHPVALSADDVVEFYEGQSNATIWPLYHDAVEQPTFHRHWREAYRRVNARYARAAADVAAPGATVWVHDYQLQLVPAMLRELRPDLRIGFFLHIPFPPAELFTRMPLREEIMRGLLGADVIGFQAPGGARNFLTLTERLLGLRPQAQQIHHQGRTITVGAFPISIDVAEIGRLAATPTALERARELRQQLGNPRTLMLGVDRLDYTKGILHRLDAYGELLAEGRLDATDTVLVQVATPSRQRVDGYRRLRADVERAVGRINGDHARIGQAVVHYLHRSYLREELVALYLAADVMVVTPLRDGMNLVAKEYVAARTDGAGALVLSEFTGAAAGLPGAHLVNPYDTDALKDTMLRAATEASPGRAVRMASMRHALHANTVADWSQSFLAALSSRPLTRVAA
ncbi:trehalose-6-phosphate synthase [Longispora sp. NPDC051575]|uniref:alpha,alpha-trehalose-phosphate synthase (UDP-forming) n=1 Tax=Longispora sp. NPDC051575 TaxID=3154943 RepID=UPI00342ACE86